MVHFTNRPPPAGKDAQVFTAKGPTYSLYRGFRFGGEALFRERYQDAIEDAAHLYRVDPQLIRAVIHAESGFNPRAVSPKGARGLMQLMPELARYLGVRNSFDPQQNIYGGVRHLATLLRKYDGSRALALAAYNAGEDAVDRNKGIPPYQETQEYVRRVLALERRYLALVPLKAPSYPSSRKATGR